MVTKICRNTIILGCQQHRNKIQNANYYTFMMIGDVRARKQMSLFAKKIKMAAEIADKMSCLELCSLRFEEVFVQIEV